MNRTFHRKLTAEATAAILLLGGMALFCFWQRNTVMALIGTIVMAAGVVAIERVIHTTYVFCEDKLVVSRGRFATPITLAVNDIVKAERMPTPLRMSHYVLLQIGPNRHLGVQPDNEEAFLNEIKRRQQQYEENF